MSPPFFSNPSFLSWGYFFIGTPCSQARFAAFFLKSLFKRTGFFVFKRCGAVTAFRVAAFF